MRAISSFGDVDKPRVVSIVGALRAFCDVRRHGGCGASELGDETEALVLREVVRELVDLQYERVALLPDLELGEALHEAEARTRSPSCDT